MPFLPLWSAGGLWRVPEQIKAGGYIERAYKKGTPPPIWGASKVFTPIIFRTKKVEKSSPQENIIFRTKNTEKSRLGRLEKISEKICGKMFRGKEKAPNLVERGQGVLKYERINYVGKDSGIICYCKRRVLSFCFRTKEPCLCLAGHCLCVLPSYGT